MWIRSREPQQIRLPDKVIRKYSEDTVRQLWWMVRSGLILVDVANYDGILFYPTNFRRQFGDSAML